MRLFGAALVVHGGVGIALLVTVALSIAPMVGSLTAFTNSAAEVEATLVTTRDAFDGFANSLMEAQRSAQRAAASARSSSAAARQLADGMSVSIFGLQPLASLAGSFRQQGTDLDALAGELDQLAISLGKNESDVRALKNDIGVLRNRAATLGAAPDARAGLIAPALYLFIAWLALEALVVAWIGISLARGRIAATR